MIVVDATIIISGLPTTGEQAHSTSGCCSVCVDTLCANGVRCEVILLDG